MRQVPDLDKSEKAIKYRIFVPGSPAPWSVYTRRGKPSTSFLAMKDYQVRLQAAALEQLGRVQLLKGPLWLKMSFACPHPVRCPHTPDKWPQWVVKNPPVRWDLRNLEKAAEDACQGVLFVNDSLVVESEGRKFYDPMEPSGYTVIIVGPADIRH